MRTEVPKTAKSSTSHDRAKQSNNFFFGKEEWKKSPKERDHAQRSQRHTDSFEHLRATEPDNVPVDHAT